MRHTHFAFFTASFLALAACGGDDTANPSPSGTSGGSGGTGGSTTGTSGSGGTSGSSGTGSTDASTNDAAGGSGGSAGTSDARSDNTLPPDVAIDRTTTDVTSSDRAGDDVVRQDAPSSDGSNPSDGTSGDANADAATDAGGDTNSSFTLTSTTIAQGMAFPSDHTCAGTNVSPPLTWTPGPAGTLSYAITLTDKTNGLIHSAIYDIPASVTSLPANVEKVATPSVPAGAKQVASYSASVIGYNGPCPMGVVHTYEFVVYAIDVAALPGVTTASSRAQLNTAILAHDLATAALSGTSDAKP